MMGLLPEVANDLHISIPTAGHLVSAYALGVVIGAPLLAALTARMPRRTVLIGLMALFVAGNALSALAPDYHWLMAARFLSGLPHGAFFGVGAVVATSMVAPERKARSVSLMFLGLTVANIAGVPVGTLLGQHLGWRATFLGVSVIGLAAVASLALLIPRAEANAAPAIGLRGELAALRSVPVWLALGTTVAGFGALFAAYSYITPMLTDSAGYADASVTLLLALFGVGATIGNLLGGRLADHAMRRTLFGAALPGRGAGPVPAPDVHGVERGPGGDAARYGGVRDRLPAQPDGDGEGVVGPVPGLLGQPGGLQPRERGRRLDRRPRPRGRLRSHLPCPRGRGAGRARTRRRGRRVRGGPTPAAPRAGRERLVAGHVPQQAERVQH